jgi:hypothetical protein
MASVAFTYECDRESGFVADPNMRKRVGYITKLDGFGLAHPAAADLTVSVSYSGQPKYSGIALAQPTAANAPRTTSVIGVVDKFSWAGGAGDAIELDFWCSHANASAIKLLQQDTLKTNAVKGLGWWIVDYDPEVKQWFEEAFPASGAAITGLIAGQGNPELNADLTPVPVTGGIDVDVYKISISVVPAANQQYSLEFANSANKPVVKSWGLVTGTLPPASA